MNLKYVRYALIGLVTIFPIFFLPFLSFAAVTAHTFLAFTIIEVTLLLWVWQAIQRGQVELPRSRVLLLWWGFIGVLFLTAATGVSFDNSFWSTFSRMSGVVTWLHYAVLASIAAAVFRPRDWQWLFRGLMISLVVAAAGSWLGPDGFGSELTAWRQGGSWLGNTSFAGAYYVLGLFLAAIGLSREKHARWRQLFIFGGLFVLCNPDLLSADIWRADTPFVVGNPVNWLGEARMSSAVAWGGLALFGFLTLMHNKVSSLRLRIGVWIGVMAIMIMGTVGIFLLAMQPGSSVQETYASLSSPSRLIVWQNALDEVAERPLLGYGLENFRFAFQQKLDASIIPYEDIPWFTRVHNFWLDTLVDVGLLGLLVKAGIFLVITLVAMRRYRRDGEAYWLFVPFVLILHLVQLQTFFDTDSTAFLLAILIGFVAAHENGKRVFAIDRARARKLWMALAVVVFIAGSIFFVVRPFLQNRLVVKIYGTPDGNERLEYLKKIGILQINPEEVLRSMSLRFIQGVTGSLDVIYASGQEKEVGIEIGVIDGIYEWYLPRYEHDYRYLVNYANVQNTAFLFYLRRLQGSEERARQAIEISDRYPQAYWVLAMSLFYQGRYDEAREAALAAQSLNPDIETSQQLLDFIDAQRDAEPVAGGVKGVFVIPKL